MEHKYSTMKTFFVHHQSKKHLTQKKPFLIAIEQKYSTPKTIICDHHQAKKNQPKINSFPSTSKHKYSAPKKHFQSPLGHNYPSTKPYGGGRTVATCKHGRSVNLVTRGRGKW
jgi:hypothetical protein